MKTFLYCAWLYLLLLPACKKQEVNKINTDLVPFSLYTIRQGEQFCDQSNFVAVKYTELKFVVKFDSSAIYRTKDPSNQNDINKLYGFSDNDSLHHQYSARFGWRWSNKALRIFAYLYNNGARYSKELGSIQIGTENTCSIKVNGSHYIFSLNNITDTLPRSATTPRGQGYKLYPYFGGDESAPHSITLLIKEYGPG